MSGSPDLTWIRTLASPFRLVQHERLLGLGILGVLLGADRVGLHVQDGRRAPGFGAEGDGAGDGRVQRARRGRRFLGLLGFGRRLGTAVVVAATGGQRQGQQRRQHRQQGDRKQRPVAARACRSRSRNRVFAYVHVGPPEEVGAVTGSPLTVAGCGRSVNIALYQSIRFLNGQHALPGPNKRDNRALHTTETQPARARPTLSPCRSSSPQ